VYPFKSVEQKITDTQLLEQVKVSDMEAFRMLFDRYQPILFRQVLFQTGQTDLSHDIVQETFIRVWEHRRSLKPHLSFLGYVFRISRNLIRDNVKHQKIRKRNDKYIPPSVLSENDDPNEALQLTLLQEEITSIMNNDLPKRCREIFLLSRFEGKTHQEIADILHLSVRTIEHQITHALKVMRKKLEQY
jgi:RNA polymerase sigma-70 factor (ECF subfamily)